MNIVDFQDELEKKSKKEIITYANTQYAALLASIEKLKQYEQEIEHLKALLDSNVTTIIKSPELCMVEAQINRLSEFSVIRSLTAEEIKSLDVLVKNKLLLNGQPTTIPGEVKKQKHYPEAVLISIAKKEN